MTAETRVGRSVFAVIAAASLALTLAGCGQKGPLILPGDVADTEAEGGDETTNDEEENQD